MDLLSGKTEPSPEHVNQVALRSEPLFPLTNDPAPAVSGDEDERPVSLPDSQPMETSPADLTVQPAARPTPFIIVRPLGAMANRMIQHMTAMKIAALVPGARISRIHLPEWGLVEPDISDVPEPTIHIKDMRADTHGAADALREGRAQSVAITGYVQHMDNLLPPDAYRHLFSSDIDVESYGEDTLLINIRAAEVLTGEFAPYVLIPIGFYRQIVDETKLTPVFFGQLSDCPYMDELRATFPEAVFRAGMGAVHDWEVLRRSKNICLSVSTFSWAACWLSNADRIIMPLTGLFNPVQGLLAIGGTFLAPVEDSRYIFYNFMQNESVSQARYREIHRTMEGHWTLVTGAWVKNMLERRKHLPRSLDDYLAVFDEDQYLSANWDLKVVKEQGLIESGLNHFKVHGFSENRPLRPFDIDYAYRYPDAAMAVSNGHYLDLVHFHAQCGRHLGYKLTDDRHDAGATASTEDLQGL